MNSPETLITSRDNPLAYDEEGTLPPYEEEGIPSGIIAMWSGSSDNIPSGWHLCDGNEGTPDLRDKFIVGAGSEYLAGNTGGSKTKSLSASNLPSHKHSFSGSAASNGSHNHNHTLSITNNGSHTHTHTLSCASAGSHNHTYSGLLNGYQGFQNGNIVLENRSNSATGSSGDHTHSISGNINSDGSHTHSLSGSISSSGSHTHTVTGTIGNTGSGTAFEILPPYYALCFIMKL